MVLGMLGNAFSFALSACLVLWRDILGFSYDTYIRFWFKRMHGPFIIDSSVLYTFPELEIAPLVYWSPSVVYQHDPSGKPKPFAELILYGTELRLFNSILLQKAGLLLSNLVHIGNT